MRTRSERFGEIDKVTFSVAEFCRALGIGRTFLYRLLREEKLPSIKVGRRRMIPREAAEQWLAAKVERHDAAD